MKRPLSTVGFTMLVSLFVFCQTEKIWFVVAVGVAALFAFLSSILIKKTKQTAFLPTLFMSVAVACFLFLFSHGYYYLPAIKMTSDNMKIEAVITDYPEFSGSRCYCMAKIKNPETKRSYKVRLSLPAYSDSLETEEKIKNLQVGDSVIFSGKLYKIAENKKEIHNSYMSRKIFLGAYPKGEITVKKAEKKTLVYYLMNEKRKTINQLLLSFEGETASIGMSLLMGEKTYLSDEIYNEFQKSGVSHLMAVSGLHLSVWLMSVLKIVEVFGLDKKKWISLLLSFNFLIMFFASFSGSVVRAGMMMFLYLFGLLIRKRPDPLNSLGFSAIIILLINPYNANNVSFLLSLTSTLAIITVASALISRAEKLPLIVSLNQRVKKIVLAVLSCLIISLSVSWITLPLVVFFFRRVATLSFLTNLLVLPVASWLVIAFGVYVMFYFLPGLNLLIKLYIEAATEYLLMVVSSVSSLPLSSITTPFYSVVPLMIVWLLLSTLGFLCFKYKSKRMVICSFCLGVLAFASLSFAISSYERKNVIITSHNADSGLCVTREHDGKRILAFAEADDYYSSFLTEEIGKTDYAFLFDGEKENIRLISETLPDFLLYNGNKNLLSSSLRNKVSAEEKLSFDSMEIKKGEKGVTVKAFGVTAVISPEAETFEADIILTNNSSSLDINEKSVIILSGENKENCLSVAENGSTTVTISKGASYCVKGENSWQFLMRKN